jgi:DNA-binding transcriptional LysR family regulator
MRMLLEEVRHAIPPFQQHYPGVRLRLLYAEDHVIASMVERGEVDLALILELGPGRTTRTTVVHELAYSLDYVLVAPSRHPLLGKRALRLRDILRYPLILGAPPERRPVAALMRSCTSTGRLARRRWPSRRTAPP